MLSGCDEYFVRFIEVVLCFAFYSKVLAHVLQPRRCFIEQRLSVQVGRHQTASAINRIFEIPVRNTNSMPLLCFSD